MATESARQHPPKRLQATDEPVEARIAEVGRDLSASLSGVLETVPGSPHGPQKLARTLGLDKALTSRVLRATRNGDPMAVAHLVPGPDPMRRLLQAARKLGASPRAVESAAEAVERFEQLIRNEAGDRSALNAIISAWLPEAREEFETRSKQTAFKGMSQLKGVMADVTLTTVILHPSNDGEHLDVLFILGLLGLRRLRPNAGVKLATRRTGPHTEPRAAATTLEGEPVEGMRGVRLDRFCNAPLAELHVQRVGDVNLYTLADNGFGPRSACDLLLAEVNPAGMQRYSPRDQKRKGGVGADVTTPAKRLLLDVFVPDDVFPGADPTLIIYDTSFDGSGNINDPARRIDHYDLVESVELLGRTDAMLRAPEFPRYPDMVRHVFERMTWDRPAYRGYRCRIEYPVYGSEVVMAFDRPPPPDGLA